MEIKIEDCKINFNDLSTDPDKNLILLDSVEYRLEYLSAQRGNKGGHSWIFKYYNVQDNEDTIPTGVIKINKAPSNEKKHNKRFKKEIETLEKCINAKSTRVITLFQHGTIDTTKNKKDQDVLLNYNFYTMECAETDLGTFIQEHADLTLLDRTNICKELADSLKELYEIGFYHRDIKPDNFFRTSDGSWKIGDLGLVANREEESSIDYVGEFIGPRGWISPETMNKFLTEKNQYVNFDITIDHQSDIFQLGKVFWYIYQGNAPIGCIMENDFLQRNHQIYILIRQMLSYNKDGRPMEYSMIIDRLHQISDDLRNS